jgi:hypothetical protein
MIEQGLCTVFLQDCLSGRVNFAVGTSYTYKIALYTALSNIGPSTLTYASATNELATGGGYTVGGKTLTVILPESENETAFVSFANVVWNPASFTARGALIYNSTTGAAVAVLDFGSDKTAVSTFTVTFPADTYTDAVIRLSQ